MGEIVNVVERPSPRPGIVRFETNRALSGMGHDRYVAGQPIEDDRSVDELARRIFARGGVKAVHINGSVVTVGLEDGQSSDGIADIIRGLYTFYVATPLGPLDGSEQGDATDAATEGHGEVAAEPEDAPHEAEGTVQPADVER